MNIIALAILLLLPPTYYATRVYEKNVYTYAVGDATIVGQQITYKDPECRPGLRCEPRTESCEAPGTIPVLTEDRKYFACCHKGQRLLGSPETAFDCCAEGHDLVGSEATGYHCCPTGFTWNGQQCIPVRPPKPQTPCSSGLETGKCYTFTAETGHRLGLRNDGVYYAAADSMIQRYGKFQLCADEACTPGQTVNPSDTTYIRDLYGDIPTGANTALWLNNAQNGAHIGRTPTFASAGKFAISKWPCGKYCLGGVQAGVGPACPAEIPAMTFYSQDPQMCVPFELTEVPCDLKSDTNNCIWKHGDQCCNHVDCTGKKPAPEGVEAGGEAGHGQG